MQIVPNPGSVAETDCIAKLSVAVQVIVDWSEVVMLVGFALTATLGGVVSTVKVLLNEENEDKEVVAKALQFQTYLPSGIEVRLKLLLFTVPEILRVWFEINGPVTFVNKVRLLSPDICVALHMKVRSALVDPRLSAGLLKLTKGMFVSRMIVLVVVVLILLALSVTVTL